MSRFFSRRTMIVAWVLGLAALVAIPFASFASVGTDQADYSPGSVVTIHGDNGDGALFQAGETVHVDVGGPNGYAAACDATADDSGAWSCQVTLNPDDSAVGEYSYTARGLSSGFSQSGSFTDGPGGQNPPGQPPTQQPPAQQSSSQTTVIWDGNGLSDGVGGSTCNTTDSDLLNPGAGKKGWLFVLSQISGTSTDWRLDVDFGPGTTDDQTGIAPIQTTANVAKWAVYSGANATLDAAKAYAINQGGTSSGNLVVSHCFTNAPVVQDLTVTKTATPAFKRTFTWGIAKKVDATELDIADGSGATFNYQVDVTHDGGTDSDWIVSGNITIHNPNNFAVTGVSVTDAIPGGACAVTGSPLDVPANGDATASYSCSFGSNPGSGTNTATATWPAIGSPNTSGTGMATFDFSAVSPNVVDGSITVNDTLGGSLGTTSYSDPSPKSFAYPYTFTGDPAGTCTSHDNTATFTTNTTGTTGSASQTVKVCVGADLTVKKDATPAFDRAFTWHIAKSVDKTQVKQVGGSATFNYTIQVTHDSGTDGNWRVTGTIHVANPNDWEDITANVADAVDNGGTCAVSGGSGVVVPAGGSVDLPYTCTYASAPSPAAGTNTATASWDSGKFHTPDGAAPGTASFDFASASPTIVDDSVNVTDPNAPNPPLPAMVTSNDPSPTTFSYSKTVAVPTNNQCTTINNTATFETNTTHTKGSDSKTVTVCGAVTGGLTIGFWQNKNGQGIIAGGASSSGVCSSGTWLRQYAPFQDLSATATCAQVGAYITNVIKAANASGASMNAMLKAQMLATALDVYFSDPGLGGNKIGAPSPLGGVKVDLTQICKNIGGGCTIFENTGGAFGGATSKTISDMLAYAAGQSNSGGTTWYGNVKAVQELAKDSFDAINNQVAFVAP